MNIRQENKEAIIGAKLNEWADLAEKGASVANLSRARHNFKQVARKNPELAHGQSTKFGYLSALREFTPQIAKQRPIPTGTRGKR